MHLWPHVRPAALISGISIWCISCAGAALWAQSETPKPATATAAPHNASSDAPSPAFITGIVLDRATGSPLRKAQVNLSTDETVPLDAQAITSADGRFAFAHIPPGKYTLHADCEGYRHVWFGAATPEHLPGIITLESGEQRHNFVLRLDAVASISGVVLDQDGDPVEQATVELWAPSFSRGKPKYAQVSSAQSNDRGEYRIHNVLPGRYIVKAAATNRAAFRIQPEVIATSQPAGPPIQSQYGAQFYPGTDHIADASELTVAPGKDIERINFRLAASSAALLRGTVIPPPELPPDSQVGVSIIRQDALAQNHVTYGASAGPPAYTFENGGMVPGDYLLVANVPSGGRPYRGVAQIHLNAGADNNVTIKLDAAVDLYGTVKIEGDTGPKAATYQVQLTPGDSIPLFGSPAAALAKPDGTFVLKNVVSGIWDIGVTPIPHGGYLKSMRLGDQDVLTEEMMITPETTAPLNIVLSTRGGTLEGDVKTDSGVEAPRVFVLLAPSGKYSQVLSFFDVVFSDQMGHFKLRGLTPGKYKLYAFEKLQWGVWQNPEFLKPYETLGEAVEISEGANPSKQLRLISVARSQP
jgi:hypothetical protein